MRRTDGLFAALAVLMLATAAFGGFSGFPVMDDGEVLTVLREAGSGAIVSVHRDRPLYGWILQQPIRVFGQNPAGWVGTAVAFWALLAWQTSRLVRRLFPGESSLSGLAALLVIAPIVVEMQYTTLTFALPGILPVSLGLEAILLALGRDPEQPPRTGLLVVCMSLAAAGSLISEYTLATIVAGAGLLLVLGRRRPLPFLVLGGLVGHLGLRWMADPNYRPATSPALQVHHMLDHIMRVPLRWISGVCYSLMGAYGSAAGAARLDTKSLSTILAFAVASACAVWVALVLGARSQEPSAVGRRELFGLLLAVGLGLLPVVLTDHQAASGGFDSRFRLPIAPFAVAATLYIANRLIIPRWRFLVAGALAYLSVNSVITGAFAARRHQIAYEALGQMLLPVVRGSEGLTVAVLADPVYAHPLAKLARRWSVEDERRAWALKDYEAIRIFGTRAHCRSHDYLNDPPRIRNVGRRGPIGRLAWVDWQAQIVELQSYCVNPVP